MNKLDKAAFDYFYHQVKYDVLNDQILEIKYPLFKDKILTLGLVIMYVDMIENKRSFDYLLRNYQNYIPRELFKNHTIFAKKQLEYSLKGFNNKGHDAL